MQCFLWKTGYTNDRRILLKDTTRKSGKDTQICVMNRRQWDSTENINT